MTDIEKVIKGLESCLNNNDCINCPYKEGYNTNLSCIGRAKKEAIELLKEQKQIVQCKDCKHRYKHSCGYYYDNGQIMRDDWFCADGERKDENAEHGKDT